MHWVESEFGLRDSLGSLPAVYSMIILLLMHLEITWVASQIQRPETRAANIHIGNKKKKKNNDSK